MQWCQFNLSQTRRCSSSAGAVALLAFPLQLDSINAATLMAFLKDRGVPCRAKDKKQDLIAKVVAAVKVPEQ